LPHDYDETVDVKKARTFLLIGDEYGHLKLWDLNGIIQKIRKRGIRIQYKTWSQFRAERFAPSRMEGVTVDEFVAASAWRHALIRQ